MQSIAAMIEPVGSVETEIPMALWFRSSGKAKRWVKIFEGTRQACLDFQDRHSAQWQHSQYCDLLPIGVDPNFKQ